MTTRAEFFHRLEPFHAPSTLQSIELAYTLAKFGHRAQVRKEANDDGTPVRYFEHVRRVALILIDEVRIVQPEMIIAALLHDGFEDTRDITPLMVEHVWGGEVVRLIKTLSKVPKDGYLDRFSMCTDWRAYVIKACDRLDNLRSLGATSREFQLRQLEETRLKYYPLFDRMLALTPEERQPRVQWLRDQILRTTEGHVPSDAPKIELEARGQANADSALTPIERHLCAVFLTRHSEALGRRGCNDFNLLTEGHMTPAEAATLKLELWKANGPPSDSNPRPTLAELGNPYAPDFAVASYLASRVRG
jgi:hypothetical protein